MYSRLIDPPTDQSFFLFGPRGTGKSTWVQQHFPKAVYLDLLNSRVFTRLLADPNSLESYIPIGHQDWVVIDEIQKVPELLDEVHRLIEHRGQRFVLTGSSARKLRRQGVNLLAGRALTYALHPLTAVELGADFALTDALQWGHLPGVFTHTRKQDFLSSYVHTYLKEEVQQEGLTRNLGAFARFLEAASFSQACPLNISEVARECAIERKVAENYFGVLEDLLIASRLPVFTKRAKRAVTGHPKFYFFDVGIYRALRPKGPLDKPEEIDGAALETLVMQETRAINTYLRKGYEMFFWRTRDGLEVDLVLYGERGLIALEIKRAQRLQSADFRGLEAFLSDYPQARAFMLYGGKQERQKAGLIRILPLERYLGELPSIL